MQVYEALQTRSPKRARAAIIAHMDFIEAKLTESLQAFDDGET
jgi:DNA-binding FadR family transcriptional regulator